MTKQQFEQLPYKFTREEIHQLGLNLALANQEVYTLRSNKKTAAASMEAAIKEAEAIAAAVTTKINQRYEMRETEVIAVMDSPRPGLKTIARADNGEPLRTEAMTLEEQQSSFSFDESQEQRNDEKQ